MLPQKLRDKIINRKSTSTFRTLGSENKLIDFSSNDYIGFAKSTEIFEESHAFLLKNNLKINGATGSRLISGNYNLYTEVENYLAKLHQSESAILFNSGYTANIGLLSAILIKDSIILYDEFIHASIRDGVQLSNGKGYKFKHNNLEDLECKLKKFKNKTTFIITESIFSMDGDSPDLKKLVTLSENYNTPLIVDEAHALGTFNLGLVEELNLQEKVFARIITFGKALGCHGAVILGSNELKEYLVNFSRAFIYTTGLTPHNLATIKVAYTKLVGEYGNTQISKLQNNIKYFKKVISDNSITMLKSSSSIQCCVIGGNKETKVIAKKLNDNGFDVKAILSPTVAKNTERIRFCLHSYNSFDEIETLVKEIKK